MRGYPGRIGAESPEGDVRQRAEPCDVGVVVHHDHTVGGATHIELDAVGVLGDGQVERLQCVLPGRCRCAAVGDDQRVGTGHESRLRRQAETRRWGLGVPHCTAMSRQAKSHVATLTGSPEAAGTMPGMHVFNTLGRRAEPFVPLQPRQVGIYVCGPTVQSRPHVGHGRAAVAFDVIRRYLVWSGYEVTYVQNVTDVEDKIIAAANAEGVDAQVLAKRNAETLRHRLPPARRAAAGPGTGRHRPRTRDDRPHRVADRAGSRLPGRGRRVLLGSELRRLRQAVGPPHRRAPVRRPYRTGGAEARPTRLRLVEGGQAGRAHLGLALGTGPARLAHRVLGDGPPLPRGRRSTSTPAATTSSSPITRTRSPSPRRPPASPSPGTGCTTAWSRWPGTRWRSRPGTSSTCSRRSTTWQPQAVRLFYLRTHYRKPLDFTREALDDATASLERLWAFRRRVADPIAAEPDLGVVEAFRSAMDDDFDTAAALAVLFDAVRSGNRLLDSADDAASLVAAYDVLMGLLGLAEAGVSLDDLGEELERVGARFGVSGSTRRRPGRGVDRRPFGGAGRPRLGDRRCGPERLGRHRDRGRGRRRRLPLAP